MTTFQEKGLAKRHPLNPLLVSQKHLPWANVKIYNPAVIYEEGITKLIFRSIGEDWISRLGYAEINKDRTIVLNDGPVLQPEEDFESHGIEDPRITKIDDTYFLVYTAYDGKCARLALATSTNLTTWEKYGPVLKTWNKGYWQKISNGAYNWSKAGALFPEKINGKYRMLFGDHHIWYAESSDLLTWEVTEKSLISPRPIFFDQGYVEMGAPPIKTERGWLVFYHGVQRLDDIPRNPRVYRIGAVLLQYDNPINILWRSQFPILEPLEEERYGIVDAYQYEGGYNKLQALTQEDIRSKVDSGDSPLAVFTCGAVMENDLITLYYSAADTSVHTAEITLDKILVH